MNPKKRPNNVLKYNPRVLVGNWYNERAMDGFSLSGNDHPEFQTSYKSDFKPYVPWWRKENHTEHGGVIADSDTKPPKHWPLMEKKQEEWKADTRYMDETKTEYEDKFLGTRPKPKPRPLTEQELTKSEERYEIEKAAARRNERNRYGPRDFKPKDFSSTARSFVLQGKHVHFTPTGDLVEVKPQRLTAHDFNTYLDAYDKSQTIQS